MLKKICNSRREKPSLFSTLNSVVLRFLDPGSFTALSTSQTVSAQDISTTITFPSIKLEFRQSAEVLFLEVYVTSSLLFLIVSQHTDNKNSHSYFMCHPLSSDPSVGIMVPGKEREHTSSTAYHAIGGGYGTRLQQGSSEAKLHQPNISWLQRCATAPALFHNLPMLNKKISCRSLKRCVSSFTWHARLWKNSCSHICFRCERKTQKKVDCEKNKTKQHNIHVKD